MADSHTSTSLQFWFTQTGPCRVCLKSFVLAHSESFVAVSTISYCLALCCLHKMVWSITARNVHLTLMISWQDYVVEVVVLTPTSLDWIQLSLNVIDVVLLILSKVIFANLFCSPLVHMKLIWSTEISFAPTLWTNWKMETCKSCMYCTPKSQQTQRSLQKHVLCHTYFPFLTFQPLRRSRLEIMAHNLRKPDFGLAKVMDPKSCELAKVMSHHKKKLIWPPQKQLLGR